MRYFLDYCSSKLEKREFPDRYLFWLTYKGLDLRALINEYPWKYPDAKWKELPKSFHKLF